MLQHVYFKRINRLSSRIFFDVIIANNQLYMYIYIYKRGKKIMMIYTDELALRSP
jgi:hypothetical protein